MGCKKGKSRGRKRIAIGFILALVTTFFSGCATIGAHKDEIVSGANVACQATPVLESLAKYICGKLPEEKKVKCLKSVDIAVMATKAVLTIGSVVIEQACPVN